MHQRNAGRRAKYSPVMWLAVPAPAEPKLTLPGLAFA
jgi:hypothetical protein